MLGNESACQLACEKQSFSKNFTSKIFTFVPVAMNREEKMKKEQVVPNFIELEKNILEFWDKNDSFHKLVKKNENHEKDRCIGTYNQRGRFGFPSACPS